MIRRVMPGVALLFFGGATARAQIIMPQFRHAPIAWTSLSIGWMQQGAFEDKDSGDFYDFGSGPQWRASLEMPIGASGTSVGLVGTMSRLPLVYNGSGLSSNSCLRCDADANVSQILAVLHMGGGATGFQQVVDVSGGVTLYSNFRSTAGAKLGNGATRKPMTFTIGYGFGYGFSSRSSVMLVQDYSLILLPRAPGSANNTTQQATLRLGFRYGLGDKGVR